MQNKIDIILKKLINEEFEKSGLVQNKLGWEIEDVTHSGNFDKVLSSDEDTHEYLVKIFDILKKYITDNPGLEDDKKRKVIKLSNLIADVLNNYEFVYNKNLSTIKNILVNFKDLNII